MTQQAPTRAAGKQHYQALDGLRGVAAVMVVIFHTCEASNGGSRFRQIINHGYLAVDFFFLLSGFVVAYAYDDRWAGSGGRMSLGGFVKRRLVRLQPMVVMGSVIGAALFYVQAAPIFPLIATTPVWKMLLVMLVGMTLLPLPISADIRGWQEMHPLNGPAWSLFFEYIANALYALVLRRLPLRWLGVLVALCAVFTLQYGLAGGRGDFIGGWSLDTTQLHIGFVRLLFPFTAGMLLMRSGWRLHVRAAFPLCAAVLVVVFCLPRFGGPAHLWVNGVYESFVVIVVFPIVVAMGAGDGFGGDVSLRASRWLGGISYPLYITHYPLIYLYTAWITRDHPPVWQSVLWGAALLFAAVSIAWACLLFYDEPVRAWLSRRFLARPA